MERISVAKAAKRLGITRSAMYWLLKQKKLRAFLDEDFKRLYLLADEVEAYKRSNRKPGPKPIDTSGVPSNSEKPVSGDDSAVYDFFTDGGE